MAISAVRPNKLLWLLTIVGGVSSGVWASDAEDHFERNVRPLLIERCHKCHAGAMAKGGLKLDSRSALLQGGESGPAVVAGRPDDSRLLHAVRHEDGLEMPPDGKLSSAQIAALAEWILAGAVWPDSPDESPDETPVQSPAEGPAARESIASLMPDDGDLRKSLQLWLRADALSHADGEPVFIWPDQSGHGRDVSATKGVRTNGVGMPGRFAKLSTIMGRPAVRFDTTTGMASSPGNLVDLHGDPALTIVVVMNLQPHDAQPPYDGVFGLGNPAHSGDPGKPLAALVQINRGEDHALHFAGGWNHDASLGSGSFKPHYGKPILLTIVKQPGAMRLTTRMYLNGTAAARSDGEPLEGRDGVPDIQHRTDIGAYLGKALDWCGSIQGDIGELLVYSAAVSDGQRMGVENYLAEKYGLWLDARHNTADPAVFTAEERSFWAYQPVNDRMLPAVRDQHLVQSPVDRFVLQDFERRQWHPASRAEKLKLLRRVSLDLVGLPPTPDEVAAFMSDNSPQAFEKVVNRLLDSPHYGERWGRHWLDVVRFAESTANDANAVMRYAWRYRNYVIDAFNSDLPYDQFLVEQLAGDLLPPADSIEVNTRRIVATGYLMVGSKALAETDKEQSRLDIVDDQIDVTGRAMLGLTVSCARCHDHKFDAIRTTDYYALAGIFRSTEPFQDEVRNATMWWEFPVPQGDGVEPLMVMAPKESQLRNLRVHLRGNRFTLGKIVPRGFVQVIAHSSSQAESRSTNPLDPNQLASGRLELAQWIASPSNPLTARVMVNRIWQHHFGRGLVATSDNFGVRGDRPANPELLDWLAARFMESGWSVKAMHRLILNSNCYQSSCADSRMRSEEAAAYQVSRRRLSAEELRDAILAASGTLDRSLGGNESGELLYERAENIGSKIRPNRLAADDPFYTQFKKRSIYLPVVRNMLPDVLALFDAADPNAVTAVRNDTTVASQSLFLLNSSFVREQARSFAERLLADNLTDDQRIEQAHLRSLSRAPTPTEMLDCRDFLAAYLMDQAIQSRPQAERQLAAWQSLCQSLLCCNEFLYVE